MNNKKVLNSDDVAAADLKRNSCIPNNITFNKKSFIKLS